MFSTLNGLLQVHDRSLAELLLPGLLATGQPGSSWAARVAAALMRSGDDGISAGDALTGPEAVSKQVRPWQQHLHQQSLPTHDPWKGSIE
jgi:hypothetical protein